MKASTTAAIKRINRQYKKLIRELPKYQPLVALAVVGVIAAGGLYWLQAGRAATGAITAEAESGTITFGGTSIADATASGGRAVRFGSATSPYNCATPRPTIQLNATGACVQHLQWLLNRITGTSLPEDGNFTTQTDQAVRAFQQSKGLTVDGIVGPATWAALEPGSVTPPTPPGPGPTPTPPAPGGSLIIPVDTAKNLATQLLANPNISFQTASGKSYFQQIAVNGTQSACSGSVPISPKLLGMLTVAARSYKIVIGVLAAGHSCNSGQHPLGKAVDLNGVNPAPGGPTGTGTGTFLHWDTMSASQKTFATGFYDHIGKIMSANGWGGMGQTACLSIPARHPKVVYFADTCNHLHVDVRGS